MPANRVRLSDFIDPAKIRLDLTSDTKPEVLQELITAMHLDAEDEVAILRMLLHRESMGSTGVGRGIAIPHCRTPLAKRLQVVYGRRPGGIPYDAMDGEPVVHLFLIVAPPVEVSNEYLPVLGRVAELAKEPDIPDRLSQAKSPEDFFRILAEKNV